MARIQPYTENHHAQDRLEDQGQLHPIDVCRSCLPGEDARWAFRGLERFERKGIAFFTRYVEAPYDRGSDPSEFRCAACGKTLTSHDKTPGFGRRNPKRLFSRHIAS